MLSTIRNLFSPGDEDKQPEPVCFLAGSAARLAPIRDALAVYKANGEHFTSISALLEAAAGRPPDLVFLDLTLSVAACHDALAALAALPRRGAVQLVSPAETHTYEQVCAIGQLRFAGEQKGLKMMAALQPPYQADAVCRTVQELGLRRDEAGRPKVTLAQALKNDWLQLWYQPKIDLATKRLSGAEGLIRVHHPKHGVIFPDKFLPGASEDDMLALTERVILSALGDWDALAGNGIPLKLAVNTPVSALVKLPIAQMLREQRPHAPNWPGLILEVTEDEIVKDLDIANDVANELRAHHCNLAIDDFGAGYSSLARLRQLPFSELKIDRSYVTACDSDRTNAGVVEVIVELAHRFGLKTVAEGIETTHESHKLQGIGCHVGQGYLFARPMEKDKFVQLLRRRTVVDPADQARESLGRPLPALRFNARP
ncbi:MAG: EAL domain-containing protein [Pseudorhodoplanes sp.]|nr:EAL domain-containing protein [Pseudorhodoplanes sp.]